MKRKHKIIATLLVSAQLLSAVSVVSADGVSTYGDAREPVLDASAYTDGYEARYEDRLMNEEYSEDLYEALVDLKERSENIETNEELNRLMLEFANLYELIPRDDAAVFFADAQLMSYGLALEVFNNIADAITEEGSASRKIRFANHLAIAYTHDVTGYYDLVETLVEDNTIDSAQEALDEVAFLVRLHRESTGMGRDMTLEIVAGKLTSPELNAPAVEGGYEEVVVPDAVKPDDSLDLDVEITDVDEEYEPASLSDSIRGLSDRTGTYYEFDEDSGTRVRVDYTITIENGEEKRTENRTVEAEGLTSMWSDRFADRSVTSVETSRPDWAVEAEEAEEESNLTLQYSVNKNDSFPVYVDTGLFTDIDGNAQYQDVYDVLYQIAINTTDGYLVEDSDKLLVIAEGRPVYILEEKEEYSQEELEGFFESFETIELLVAETRIGTSDSLEWQLRTNQAQNVLIDDEEVELITSPDIRGDRVVLPVIEMMEAVGATIEEDYDYITARYDEFVITFEGGVAEARINDELVSLEVPVEHNEQGVVTTNLMPVFAEIGIDAVWDEQESMLVLNNTLRPDMADATDDEESDDDSEAEAVDTDSSEETDEADDDNSEDE